MFALVQLVARPRLFVDGLGSGEGFSFPSWSVTVYSTFVFALILMHRWRGAEGRREWLLSGSSVAFLMAIGCSRMYVGAHWLWDLLAGYAIAAALVFITEWVRRRLVKSSAD